MSASPSYTPPGYAQRPFDLVVYGATGFTGRLVAEYLQQRYGVAGAGASVRWAMAGRSLAKLAQVRSAIGAPATLPLIAADATDLPALHAMAQQARAVITTVGPYQQVGDTLLQACVDTGTDYLDLCGEPAWMAAKIAQHQGAAQASGARIVFSCGFDSVPFDMGVRYLQHAAIQRYGQPLQHVHGHVLLMKGTFSGGTAASLVATLEAVAKDRSVAAVMANPFALTAVHPGFTGPPQPDNPNAQHEAHTNSWSAPFVMATINTKNVHRSNALLQHLYGTGFVYEERQVYGEGTDTGQQGELLARGAARTFKLQNLALGFGPSRALLRRFVLPKPGAGPSAVARERGRYVLRFTGQHTAAGGKTEWLSATLKGDRDPGYGSTSKIITECALALVQDTPHSTTAGGVWTPASALGLALVPRLHERAGLAFAIDS
jgi:short subunit dehydrogenase-like uncharacterized protein